jgi:hypothetical protein
MNNRRSWWVKLLPAGLRVRAKRRLLLYHVGAAFREPVAAHLAAISWISLGNYGKMGTDCTQLP